MTSRGFTEEDFEKVAEYFDRAVEIAVKVKKSTGEIFHIFLTTEQMSSMTPNSLEVGKLITERYFLWQVRS